MLLYWTVIRANPSTGACMSEWVRAATAAGAPQVRTAVTNAGFTTTLAVFRGRHFNRLEK